MSCFTDHDNFILPKELSQYKVIEDISDGARKKLWVSDGKNKFLYKKNKQFPNGDYTFENLSEFLAKEIGNMICVPCVTIIMLKDAILSKVEYSGTIHAFIEYSEELQHSFHMSDLSTFDISTLLDRKSNEFYDDVLEMLFFDILIGNSDRHPGNFMYQDNHKFYPLFDNGSSLCSYIEEDKIKYFLKDTMRYNAMLTTESRPVLRTDQRITHYELLQILKQQMPGNYNNFRDKLTLLNIEEALKSLDISNDRRELLFRFLSDRKAWFYE